jgi:hypothetical protein
VLINKICEHLSGRIEAGELGNNDIIQIIELCGSYLNIQTISDYARSNGISYNGAKNYRTAVQIFGVKFIIDNK